MPTFFKFYIVSINNMGKLVLRILRFTFSWVELLLLYFVRLLLHWSCNANCHLNYTDSRPIQLFKIGQYVIVLFSAKNFIFRIDYAMKLIGYICSNSYSNKKSLTLLSFCCRALTSFVVNFRIVTLSINYSNSRNKKGGRGHQTLLQHDVAKIDSILLSRINFYSYAFLLFIQRIQALLFHPEHS